MTTRHLDAFPTPIVVIDRDGIVTEWNQAAVEVFGWTRDEAVGQFHPAIPEHRRPQLETLIGTVQATGKPRELEVEFQLRDDSRLRVPIAVSPDEDGGLLIVGLGHHVDSRIERLHRAEVEVLRMIAARVSLTVILDTVVSGIERLIPGVTGSVLFVEDGRIWDAAGPNLPRSLRDAFHGLEIGPAVGSCGTAAYTGQPTLVSDIHTDPRWENYRHLTDQAGLRACWSVPVLNSKSGTVIATFAVYSPQPLPPTEPDVQLLEDLAELVGVAIESSRTESRLQQLLAENRAIAQRFRLLLESVSDGIYGLDLEGRCTFINPAALDMLGYRAADELAGRNMHSMVHHTRPDGSRYPEEECPIYSAIRRRESGQIEDELMFRSDGTSFPAVYTSAPMVDPETGEVIGGVVGFQDVSQLIDYQRRLEELLASKDEFIASVAHELRTPLTAVVGFGEVLQEAWSDLSDDEAFELLGHISHESTEVAAIVEDLLVAARADLGSFHIEITSFELGDQVATVLNNWKQGALAHLELEGEPVRALADPARVRQIVRNLLNNAATYGGGEIWLQVGAEDGSATLNIVDNGPGIPADKVDEVFEPYGRAHERQGRTASLGLGLSISRRLARAMDGDLTYERSEGWSRFRLTLPRP